MRFTKKITKKQRHLYKRIDIGLLVLIVLFVVAWALSHANFAVLNPKGIIAEKEYHLIVFGTILSLLIIVPVFTMTFVIVRKYRVNNKPKSGKKPKYTPEWDGDRRLEAIWWGVPLIFILVLANVTWRSSHDLDPFKPISATVSANPPIKVQVIALQWKWLFIYPEQGIASVNYLQFPANTPVDFQITADAPMNSFWIPQLGGQIYAMSGMSTQLHLIAKQPGEFRGVSANLSGAGFAGMNFLTRSVPNNEFTSWVQRIKYDAPVLNNDVYNQLAKPSQNNKPTFYTYNTKNTETNTSTSVYDTVMEHYMLPAHTVHNADNMNNMSGMMP